MVSGLRFLHKFGQSSSLIVMWAAFFCVGRLIGGNDFVVNKKGSRAPHSRTFFLTELASYQISHFFSRIILAGALQAKAC